MTHTKLTKIVATIGPASESEEKLEALIKAGVNVFRFNTKHSTPAWHDEKIKLAQKVADRMGSTMGILLDLQGPEIRLETRDQMDIEIEKGQLLKIGLSFTPGVEVIIPHAAVFPLIKPGSNLFIEDGFIETTVVKVEDDMVIVEVQNNATIKNRKGVNLPGVDVDFPSLIDRDIEQLEVNAVNKVDFVGLSFVRSAHDVALLRAELLKRGMKSMIIGKIESQPALDRLDEIIHECDVIMIARGDLGIEVPIEQLAFWQRTIIDKCRLASKPVITATQMLESMITKPRPTNAEVTDVAHAVFEGTDAIMLSGETAGGKYPVRVVEVMAKIAKWNEGKRDVHQVAFDETDPTSTIAAAAVTIVHSKIKPHISKVLVFTETGYTARVIAKHRLGIPVIAATNTSRTCEALTLSFGIQPVLIDLPVGEIESAKEMVAKLLRSKVFEKGETIIVVHGQHWGHPGNTNSLSIVTL